MAFVRQGECHAGTSIVQSLLAAFQFEGSFMSRRRHPSESFSCLLAPLRSVGWHKLQNQLDKLLWKWPGDSGLETGEGMRYATRWQSRQRLLLIICTTGPSLARLPANCLQLFHNRWLTQAKWPKSDVHPAASKWRPNRLPRRSANVRRNEN